jgi:hypothetical protein
MTTTFEYTVNADDLFPNRKVDLPRFEREIHDCPITVALNGVSIDQGNCVVVFKADLLEGESQMLDTVVKAHSGAPLAVDTNVVLTTPTGTPLATSVDGRLVSRNTIATPGMGTHLRSFNFTTAKKNSLVCASPLNVAYTDVAYKMFDAAGVETQVDAEAVETRIEFEANYNQELVGGGIIVDPTLIGGTSDAWWAAAIAAPHIPAAYGGQVGFVSKINLEMLIDGYLDIDGRSAMYIAYDSVNHSGLIRFTFWHPVGAQKRMLVYLETFR